MLKDEIIEFTMQPRFPPCGHTLLEFVGSETEPGVYKLVCVKCKKMEKQSEEQD